jgi:simple sugar transport system substrate-binding protein
MIGFVKGKGLESNEKESIDEFIDALASDKLNLFSGPLNFQDGSVYLKEGETATDHQIWYTKQLLEGIDGASSVD